jgi:hypothetical protein
VFCLIVQQVSQAVSGVVAGIIQELVDVSQICHQEHSPKQLLSARQIFQFTLNFQFTLIFQELTSILFSTHDKPVQLLLSNFCPLFKVILIADDK